MVVVGNVWSCRWSPGIQRSTAESILEGVGDFTPELNDACCSVTRKTFFKWWNQNMSRKNTVSKFIMQMQVKKNTKKYYLDSGRKATVQNFLKKKKPHKSWQGCGGKGILIHCWWECKPIQPLWKTMWRFLTKLK